MEAASDLTGSYIVKIDFQILMLRLSVNRSIVVANYSFPVVFDLDEIDG
jgi:hypothetical protein